MKITVALELNDANELGGLSQFVKEVEAYRNPAKAMEAAMTGTQAAAPAPAPPAPQQAVMNQPLPEPQVVASITPAGVVKGPKQEELNQAALSYAEKHGMDKAFALVREFGVAKVTELKDPAKMAELYARFQAGLK